MSHSNVQGRSQPLLENGGMGEEKGWSFGNLAQKSASSTTKPLVLTFGNIGVLSHKKAALVGGEFEENFS